MKCYLIKKCERIVFAEFKFRAKYSDNTPRRSKWVKRKVHSALWCSRVTSVSSFRIVCWSRSSYSVWFCGLHLWCTWYELMTFCQYCSDQFTLICQIDFISIYDNHYDHLIRIFFWCPEGDAPFLWLVAQAVVSWLFAVSRPSFVADCSMWVH